METLPGDEKLKQEAEKISIRSEEVQDIMGAPPGWLVRWGIGVMFAVVVIILLGSGVFKYPDIVTAPVIITTENPPSFITARSTGRLATIFRKDGDHVSTYDTLAVIENPARSGDVFRLRHILKEANSYENPEEFFAGFSFPGDMVLGDIQPEYNQLLKAVNDFNIFESQDFYSKKISALKNELKEYEDYYSVLESQRDLAVNDLELTLSQFRRDSLLYASGVISTSDIEKSRSSMLEKKQSVESARLNLSNTAVTIARLNHSITDTSMEEEERRQDLVTRITSSLRQLESSLAAWEKKYLLVSSTEGILNYMMVWSDLQEVREGDPVFSVVPEEKGELYARLILPHRGAGKVSPGQRVNIKLDGYPFMEFGMLEASVHSISSGPIESGFPAVLHLIKGPVTSYGYEIEVVRQLTGTAEISTDDLSLLERMVNPVRHLIRHRARNHDN